MYASYNQINIILQYTMTDFTLKSKTDDKNWKIRELSI